MTLKLVGNGTADTITLDGKVLAERPGGIYTIASHLRVPHWIYPTYTRQVHVEMHSDGRRRSYWTPLGRKDPVTDVPLPWTDWTHISYLNRVDFNPQDANSDWVSADLTAIISDLPLLKKWLRSVDFLLINEEEQRLLHSTPPKCDVIIRGKDTIWRSGSSTESFPNEHLEVKNPVGAGDVFVAEFLNQITTDNPINARFIKQCVDASLEYLREQNTEA